MCRTCGSLGYRDVTWEHPQLYHPHSITAAQAKYPLLHIARRSQMPISPAYLGCMSPVSRLRYPTPDLCSAFDYFKLAENSLISQLQSTGSSDSQRQIRPRQPKGLIERLTSYNHDAKVKGGLVKRIRLADVCDWMERGISLAF